MAEWFFSRKGVRSGPHLAANMIKFAAKGCIDDDTLCWTSGFGSEWKPFSQTELYIVPQSDPGEPPPRLPVDDALLSPTELTWLRRAAFDSDVSQQSLVDEALDRLRGECDGD